MTRRHHFAVLAALLSALLPAVLLAGAPISALAAPTPPAPTRVGVAPTHLPGPVTNADRALALHSLRKSLTREQMYFVMADRFANGSRANDSGGLTGGRLETGLDPSHKGFYHGGDLRGLTGKLDYILGLGTTAIWLTPAFKNQPVQGSGTNASAGYHGYWVTDFTQIDPHLGTNADLPQRRRQGRQGRQGGSTTPRSTTTAATRRSPARTASTATSSVSTTCSPSGPRSSRA
jgi:Alpha amylase, catalytic domain